MKVDLRTASKLVLAGTLAFLTAFNAGCGGNSASDSSADPTPPPMSAERKQELDAKTQADSQVIDSLKNKK